MKRISQMHRLVKFVEAKSLELAHNTSLDQLQSRGLPSPKVADIIRVYSHETNMEVADIVEMLYLCRDNSFLDPLRIPSPTRLRVTKEGHDFIDTFIGLPVGKWSASLVSMEPSLILYSAY